MAKRDLPGSDPRRDGGAGFHEVSKAFDDVSFPTTQQELLQLAGRRTIEVGKGRVISLYTIIHRLPSGQFATHADLMQAIHTELLIEGLIDEDQAA